MKRTKLAAQAAIKFILGLVFVGVMIFWPAGSLKYRNGWLFIGLLFIPIFLLGVVLLIKAPNLLEKRLGAKEKEDTQKGVVAASGLLFFAGFVVSGMDFRFGWSQMPHWVVIAASAVLLISYGLYAEVMRENAYLSRTIEVQDGQKVVDTGLYGIVRHPMYLATLLMFLPLPLILGSFWGLIPFALYPVLIAVRMQNEEKVLTAKLAGYAEYKEKVKYRLIPFVW